MTCVRSDATVVNRIRLCHRRQKKAADKTVQDLRAPHLVDRIEYDETRAV